MVAAGGMANASEACIRIEPHDDAAGIVSQAPAGSTFCFAPGVHRPSQPIVARDGDTFVGESAVISGARVVTDFVSEGSVWSATVPVGQPVLHGLCRSGDACMYPNDVFVDGKLQRRVLSESAVVPGAYFQDPSSGRLVLGSDPTNRVVEIAVTPQAFTGPAAGVTLRDLTVQMFANRAQVAAVDGRAGTGWTIERVESRLNHGIGISIGSGGRVVDSSTHHNGQMGMSGSGSGAVVERTEVAYNNTLSFEDTWEAGGTKFVHSDGLIVRGNHVHHNRGPGLWTDGDNINTLYENNVVEYNGGHGIFHEISYAATIRNNVVRGNGFGPSGWKPGAGIQINNSRDVKVYGNRVLYNANGVMLWNEDRTTGMYSGLGMDGEPWQLRNVVVRDNLIKMRRGQTGMLLKDGGREYFTKRGIVFRSNDYRLGRRKHYFEWRNWIRSPREWRGYGQDRRGTFRRIG